MGRPLSTRSVIVLWCLDSQVFTEVAIHALRTGRREEAIRAMRCAGTCSRLAAERIEALRGERKASK